MDRLIYFSMKNEYRITVSLICSGIFTSIFDLFHVFHSRCCSVVVENNQCGIVVTTAEAFFNLEKAFIGEFL